MKLIDVYWSFPVNMIVVRCDCGCLIDRPSNYSVVRCPNCGRSELWHSIDPKPNHGPWSLPTMEQLK